MVTAFQNEWPVGNILPRVFALWFEFDAGLPTVTAICNQVQKHPNLRPWKYFIERGKTMSKGFSYLAEPWDMDAVFTFRDGGRGH